MIDDSIYVFGGTSKNIVYNGIYKVTWPQNEWSYLGNLSRPLAGGSIVNQCNKTIILSGGIWNKQGWVNNFINIFNVNASEIIDKDEYKIEPPTAYMDAVIVDNQMYIIGGDNDGDPHRNVQICNLDHSVCGVSKSKKDDVYFVFVIGGLLIVLIFTYSVYKRYKENQERKDEMDDAAMLMIGK